MLAPQKYLMEFFKRKHKNEDVFDVIMEFFAQNALMVIYLTTDPQIFCKIWHALLVISIHRGGSRERSGGGKRRPSQESY